MPHPTTAPPLFTTRATLDHYLTTTGTWNALHTALRAATPRLTSHPHDHANEPVCGLHFTEDTPHTRQARTTGSVLTTPDGHITVRAHAIPGHRWLAALRHLGTLHPHALRPGTLTPTPADPAAEHWSLRPHLKDRSFIGHLHLPCHAHAQTLTELPDTLGDVTAMLTIAPNNHAACPAAWQHATGFLHVLTTGTPAPTRP